MVSGEGHALREAVEEGLCNVVDVGAGWSSGVAARTAGEALLGLLDEGLVERGQVRVVAKVGWQEGEELAAAVELLRPRRLLGELVPMNAHVAFCFQPDVLEAQLRRLLDTLGLRRLDAVLLDHPEHYSARHTDPSLRHSPAALRSAILSAFDRLESLRSQGLLDYYGITSASFVEPPGDALRAAQRAARDLDLGQMAVRPLIGNHPGLGPVRLSETREHEGKDLPALLKEAFDYTIHLEKGYPPVEQPDHHEYAGLPAPIELSWAQIISANQERLGNLAQWLDVLHFQIQPTLDRAYERLYKDGRLIWWVSKYKVAARRLFERYTWHLERRQLDTTRRLKVLLDASCSASSDLPLAQRALRFCIDDPFVHCTILGVRNPVHLKDVRAVLSSPNTKET